MPSLPLVRHTLHLPPHLATVYTLHSLHTFTARVHTAPHTTMPHTRLPTHLPAAPRGCHASPTTPAYILHNAHCATTCHTTHTTHHLTAHTVTRTHHTHHTLHTRTHTFALFLPLGPYHLQLPSAPLPHTCLPTLALPPSLLDILLTWTTTTYALPPLCHTAHAHCSTHTRATPPHTRTGRTPHLPPFYHTFAFTCHICTLHAFTRVHGIFIAFTSCPCPTRTLPRGFGYHHLRSAVSTYNPARRTHAHIPVSMPSVCRATPACWRCFCTQPPPHTTTTHAIVLHCYLLPLAWPLCPSYLSFLSVAHAHTPLYLCSFAFAYHTLLLAFPTLPA